MALVQVGHGKVLVMTYKEPMTVVEDSATEDRSHAMVDSSSISNSIAGFFFFAKLIVSLVVASSVSVAITPATSAIRAWVIASACVVAWLRKNC